MGLSRVLVSSVLLALLPGCSEDSVGVSYPLRRNGAQCRFYKGFDRHPPAVVLDGLRARGLDSRRLIGRTVCGDVVGWQLLPLGADINVIPPPDVYKDVWLEGDGSVVVSPDDFAGDAVRNKGANR